MDANIFSFENYRAYLLKVEQSSAAGFRSKISQAIGCQNAYVSRVFKGDADFSLEQADLISDFLSHNESEREFFFLLLNKARAGTKKLRHFFEKKIQQISSERLLVRNRVDNAMPLDAVQRSTYYSHWIYAAVHILSSIPAFQTRENISKRLKVSPQRVSEVLEFLVKTALVEQKQGRYEMGKRRIHLRGDSHLIFQHHLNWRHKAIQELDSELDNNLHYSSVISLTQSDLAKCKEIFLSAIENLNQTVANSKDETMACLSFDLFEL